MLSRVAERMYWAGRYLERVETTARLVSVYVRLLLDLPPNTTLGWRQLLRVLSSHHEFERRHGEPNAALVQHFLLADETNPGSLLNAVHWLRENIRTTRDIVPSEGWECINELYLMSRRELPKAADSGGRFECLSDCVTGCQLLSGLLAGTMSHGDGYQFFRIGNYLERADMTTRVVDVAAATLAEAQQPGQALSNTLWMGVLKSVSAYQMYRQYVRRRVTARDAVNFLLSDPHFPKALGYTIESLGEALARLPNHADSTALVAELPEMVSVILELDLNSAALHDGIDGLQLKLGQIHGSIEETWFLKP